MLLTGTTWKSWVPALRWTQPKKSTRAEALKRWATQRPRLSKETGKSPTFATGTGGRKPWDARALKEESASAVRASDDAAPRENPGAPTFQQAIQRLQTYWSEKTKCMVWLPHSTEVGAGTMNPATFLRVLGPEPWHVCYPEPSIRPDDSRFGDNPNRVQRHTQFQVILKPEPGNAQELLLGSLEVLGISVKDHDVRFVEDNWESPALGSWGLGWEVWLDGMEITQFTYFQQAGGMQTDPVSVEITYGLERILMSLQGVNHFKDIRYNDDVTYGELFLQNEYEMSCYNINEASIEDMRKRFQLSYEEGMALVEKKLPVPAYDGRSFLPPHPSAPACGSEPCSDNLAPFFSRCFSFCDLTLPRAGLLKASHAFNILDARGAVGVTERAKLFAQMRNLSRDCARLWVQRREELGFPLGQVTLGDLDQSSPSGEAAAAVDAPADFVLELGSEELPADEVLSVADQAKAKIESLLTESCLGFDSIVTSGSPRRVFVLVRGLAPKQEDRVEDVRGPPGKIAFDGDGNPTKAVLGYCKKNACAVEDIELRKDKKGVEYCWVSRKVVGKSAAALLAEALPDIVTKTQFKRSMRWNSKATYSRPLRWIVALHGPSVVPFTACGVTSGKTSSGMR